MVWLCKGLGKWYSELLHLKGDQQFEPIILKCGCLTYYSCKLATRSIVHIPLVTTLAIVYNGRSFIGTSELYLRVSDTSPSTFWAVHVRVNLICTDLVSHDCLGCRKFRTEKRGEIGWFSSRYNCPGRGVFIFCAAAFAMKNVLLTAF
jgi:hypothetical protein